MGASQDSIGRVLPNALRRNWVRISCVTGAILAAGFLPGLDAGILAGYDIHRSPLDYFSEREKC